MQRTNWILITGALTLLLSCGKQGAQTYEISSIRDAEKFVDAEKEKNTYEKKIKEVNFRLRYISHEQMALRDLDDLSTATQASFDSLAKGYEDFLFFNLEIEIDHFSEEMVHYMPNANVTSQFEERTAYYSFGMQKDICIVLAEKDTIPCTVYHYERNYGVSPKNNFMLGFRSGAIKNAVLIYDNTYLTTGPVKFALNEQDLLNHPKIKIN